MKLSEDGNPNRLVPVHTVNVTSPGLDNVAHHLLLRIIQRVRELHHLVAGLLQPRGVRLEVREMEA